MQEGLLLCSVSATAWSGHGQRVGLPRAHQHPFPSHAPEIRAPSPLPPLLLGSSAFPMEQHCQEAIPLTCAYQTRSR